MRRSLLFLVLFLVTIPQSALSDEWQLTTGVEPSWSPDGSQIAFSLDLDIWVIPATGGPTTRITTDNTGEDRDPAWSPDGSQIAFTRRILNTWDIWAVPATGGTATQITTHPAGDRYPTWSPDGSMIAFESDRGGTFEIWAIPATGGTATQITTNGGSWPDWSPDGSEIAYTNLSPNYSIWAIPATGGTARRITIGATDNWAAWSPDGGLIAFASDRVNETDIWVKPPVLGGALTQITDSPYFDSVSDWSPDGSMIVYQSFRFEGGTQIWVIEMETTSVTHTNRPGRLPELIVAPNPTRADGFIEWATDHPAVLKLYDPVGRMVATREVGAGRRRIAWRDVVGHQRLASGVYFVELESPSGRQGVRVVLRR